MQLHDYVAAIHSAISRQDGQTLAYLLQVAPRGSKGRVLVDGIGPGKDLKRACQRLHQFGLEAFLESHLLCLHAFYHQRYDDAAAELQNSANSFLEKFRSWESGWAMAPLHRLVFDLRTVSEMADSSTPSGTLPPERLKAAGSFLMKVFGALAGKGPKRSGALYVACQLFKIYFKLDTLHLCNSVIRVIEGGLNFDDFPARDQVTYKYYTGRLEVFNDNFKAADESLQYALRVCHAKKRGNIRRILNYLIPVRMSLGHLPTEALLHNYSLPQYLGIVRAMRRGDVRLLRTSLQEHEEEFLRAGVYLVLEKLELQVYRRLVKKMYHIQRETDPARAHQIKMEGVVSALKWLQVEMDTEEVECIMAVMIYKSLMKGYFSHKSKVVVLSKADPFPKTIVP